LIELENSNTSMTNSGHASGDILLQAVAQRLAMGISTADSACRYGGDEFIIMLPETENPGIATTLAAEIGR
jgi:diguanylate cyclase (GGDEF)-like protein